MKKNSDEEVISNCTVLCTIGIQTSKLYRTFISRRNLVEILCSCSLIKFGSMNGTSLSCFGFPFVGLTATFCIEANKMIDSNVLYRTQHDIYWTLNEFYPDFL